MLSHTKSRIAGKKFLAFMVILFTVFFSYTIFAQQLRSLRGDYKFLIPEKIQRLLADPLPSGTYSVGTTGDFPTIDSAFNKLSVDGIAGSVTVELVDTFYQAPTDAYGFRLNGPIPGANLDNQVTIRPAVNKNVTIEGNGASVLSFVNTSYLTLDGIALTGTTTLTVHALYNKKFDWNDPVDFMDNSDHNVVQNIIAYSEDYTRYCAGIGFWIVSSSTPSAADSNLIHNNFIKKAGYGGILVSGQPLDAAVNKKATGNIISGNFIGSETDSLITWGIQTECCQNTIIENNIVQNVRHNSNLALFVIVHGINSYWCSGSVIRNNVVHNVYEKNSYYGAAGILLSGDNGKYGENNLIYNNMVYDIRNSSSQSSSYAAGIQIWYQRNPKIFYNSIFLNDAGSSPSKSSALNIYEQCTNVEAKNNIFVNTRDESPYTASSIGDYSASNLTSDYNALFCGSNQNNCLVKIGNTKYNTLAEWQATGKDSNSVNEMANFIDPFLHIDKDIPTHLESGAIPIEGIDSDFDTELRDATAPDIGADEFDGIIDDVSDENENIPTEYTLFQNYPNPFNPSTKIRYSIPQSSNVVIKVFDILGNEIETLVNEQKPAGTYEAEFYSHSGEVRNLPSGVYFYQLKAGDFVETKKMIVIK